MDRCTICRRPMQVEYVEMPRTDVNNQVELYRNVRRYYCPEGCRGVRLDFSKASPASSGVLLKVMPKVKPLKKEPDFNDRLLAIGLIAGYLLLVVGVIAMPAAVGIKVGAAALLTLALLATYRFATQRVVLPSYFPVPYPVSTPGEVSETVPRPAAAAAPAAPAATAAAPAANATPATAASTAAAAPAAALGGGVAMKVVLGGEEYALDVAPGENMLEAALNREVGLDYSCLEGLCDSCAVRVLAGTENITPPTQEEIDMLGEDVYNGMRLACQVKVNGPVSIEQ